MDKKWDKINDKILGSNPDFEVPDLPFDSKIVIKDYNFLYAKIYDKEKLIQMWGLLVHFIIQFIDIIFLK